MAKLNFSADINASVAKVWRMLWDDVTYPQWTSAFMEGSHAVSDWQEGSKILFLGPGGSGMHSVIEKMEPRQYIAFRHIGEVKNGEEQPPSEAWGDAMETYTLTEENGITRLVTEIDVTGDFVEYMQKTFPVALDKLKTLSESPCMLTVKATVAASAEKVWNCWNQPEHIMQWCFAIPEWHCPSSVNDLQTGGKFVTRMEARDGSFGFEFWGVYTEVTPPKKIAYTMGDGRVAVILFNEEKGGIHIVESFEAENENPLTMQQGGWQAILDNFKKYTESLG